jgi:hypothetical protein
MIGLITFDTEEYTLDMARLSASVVSLVLLRVLCSVFKQRKYIKGSYYSPVLIFTSVWLCILFAVSFIPLVSNKGVISSGPIFILIAASYVWSLAGIGWVLSNYVKQYKEMVAVIEKIPKDLTVKDKAV